MARKPSTKTAPTCMFVSNNGKRCRKPRGLKNGGFGRYCSVHGAKARRVALAVGAVAAHIGWNIADKGIVCVCRNAGRAGWFPPHHRPSGWCPTSQRGLPPASGLPAPGTS